MLEETLKTLPEKLYKALDENEGEGIIDFFRGLLMADEGQFKFGPQEMSSLGKVLNEFYPVDTPDSRHIGYQVAKTVTLEKALRSTDNMELRNMLRHIHITGLPDEDELSTTSKGNYQKTIGDLESIDEKLDDISYFSGLLTSRIRERFRNGIAIAKMDVQNVMKLAKLYAED